jgi:hypothetical protein
MTSAHQLCCGEHWSLPADGDLSILFVELAGEVFEVLGYAGLLDMASRTSPPLRASKSS